MHSWKMKIKFINNITLLINKIAVSKKLINKILTTNSLTKRILANSTINIRIMLGEHTIKQSHYFFKSSRPIA
jgi:hypothetical protein